MPIEQCDHPATLAGRTHRIKANFFPAGRPRCGALHAPRATAINRAVLQIVFNEISAAEMSRIDTLDQLALMDEFRVTEAELENLDGERFGRMERAGKKLFRFRAKDYRFYFEVANGTVIVHRVLHKGTFSDFAFRSKLPVGEDEELAKSKHFWNLIDEGRNARRA